MKYFTKEWLKKGSSAEDFLRAREQIYKEIPQDLAEQFGFHDGGVLSLEEVNGNIEMIIDKKCLTFGNNSRCVKVTFKNGKVIERDDNLTFASAIIYVDGREYVDSYCTWLDDELYKTDNGYEAHMLLLDQWEYGYLTIAFGDIKIENFAEQKITHLAGVDRAICERIETSCGLRRIINGHLHDAGIESAQAIGLDFVLTLNLNECETKENICYRKVMKIIFENVSYCSVEDDETTLANYYVSRHREEILDGKIRFAFELWNDSDNMLPLILCCDDVTVEYSLVND